MFRRVLFRSVQASEVTIKSDMVSQPTGRLLLPSEDSVENPERKAAYLPHLVISDPSPSLDGDGVVYLIAREKLYHQKSWVLAVDMNSKTLRSVAPFGMVEDPCDSVVYCTSRSASNTWVIWWNWRPWAIYRRNKFSMKMFFLLRKHAPVLWAVLSGSCFTYSFSYYFRWKDMISCVCDLWATCLICLSNIYFSLYFIVLDMMACVFGQVVY